MWNFIPMRMRRRQGLILVTLALAGLLLAVLCVEGGKVKTQRQSSQKQQHGQRQQQQQQSGHRQQQQEVGVVQRHVEWLSLETELNILPNGDMKVRERHEMVFVLGSGNVQSESESTMFTRGFRTFHTDIWGRNDGVVGVEVREIVDSEMEAIKVGTPERPRPVPGPYKRVSNAAASRPGTFTVTQESGSSDIVLLYFFTPRYGGPYVFEVTYVVQRPLLVLDQKVHRHKDRADVSLELFWSVIPEEFQGVVFRSSTTLLIPPNWVLGKSDTNDQHPLIAAYINGDRSTPNLVALPLYKKGVRYSDVVNADNTAGHGDGDTKREGEVTCFIDGTGYDDSSVCTVDGRSNQHGVPRRYVDIDSRDVVLQGAGTEHRGILQSTHSITLVPKWMSESSSSTADTPDASLFSNERFEIRAVFLFSLPTSELASFDWVPKWQYNQRWYDRVKLFLLILSPLIALFPVALYWRYRPKKALGSTHAMGRVVDQPPSNMPPAVASALMNNCVGPSEIMCTLVDLARRGHLYIYEYPNQPGYTLAITPQSHTALYQTEPHPTLPPMFAFEVELLSALFPRGGSGVYRLIPTKRLLNTALKRFNTSVFSLAVSSGYMHASPEKFRGVLLAGVVVGFIVSLFGFATLSNYVDTTIPFWCTVFGLGATFVLGVVPSFLSTRTPRGDAERDEWRSFKKYLHEISDPQSVAHHPVMLRVFDHYLPYAVAFGQSSRWNRTWDHIFRTPHATTHMYWPMWYHYNYSGRSLQSPSSSPPARPTETLAFGDRLDRMITSSRPLVTMTSSKKSSSSSSGFSSGGSSGGGGSMGFS